MTDPDPQAATHDAPPPARAGGPARSARRDLCMSTTDAAHWGVMTGIGEFYFVLFALAVGLSQTLAGLLSSLPMVVGGFIQLISPAMVGRLGSHKRWVVLCAHVQAAAFVPLVLGAVLGWAPAWLLFASVTLYWASGLAGGGAWNTWITTLVPARVRTRYFAGRNRLAQGGILLGMVGGGVTLQTLKGDSADSSWFAILFAAAFLGRIISARCLAAKSEPVPLPTDQRRITWPELLSARKGPAGRVLVYMLAVQVCVQFSAPYFAPYMRAQLGLSYAWYMVMASASFVGKMLALTILASRPGLIAPRALLWFGGVGLVPMAGLWALSDNYAYLLALQIAGGIVWAMYEMATMLLVFETVAPNQRTGVLTAYNALQATALAIGSIAGGIVLRSLHEHKTAYHLIFLASSVGRLGAVALLARIPIPAMRAVPLILRPIAVRFSGNTIVRPILPTLPEDRPRAPRRRARWARRRADATDPPTRGAPLKEGGRPAREAPSP